MGRYMTEASNPAKSCKSRGKYIRCHFKNTRETAKMLKGMNLRKAQKYAVGLPQNLDHNYAFFTPKSLAKSVFSLRTSSSTSDAFHSSDSTEASADVPRPNSSPLPQAWPPARVDGQRSPANTENKHKNRVIHLKIVKISISSP